MFRQRKWAFSWTLNYKLEVRLRKALSGLGSVRFESSVIFLVTKMW